MHTGKAQTRAVRRRLLLNLTIRKQKVPALYRYACQRRQIGKGVITWFDILLLAATTGTSRDARSLARYKAPPIRRIHARCPTIHLFDPGVILDD